MMGTAIFAFMFVGVTALFFIVVRQRNELADTVEKLRKENREFNEHAARKGYSWPAAWDANPDQDVIDVVRRTILDWDGSNRVVVREWLRNHGRTADDVMNMDWRDVYWAFQANVPANVAFTVGH